ncbi:MAG: hypothetical protein KAW12_07310 [Candidatus Aminicenantes bacterium]|nr:hypothetical protein [Candidatus Aminicenantes bacterium]
MELMKKFDLPPSLDLNWISQQALDTWEGVIQDISLMIQELEIESVAAGHRPCAWRTIGLKEIDDFSRRCAEIDLSVLPVKQVGDWGNGFSHFNPPVKEGETPNIYCIIYRNIQDARVLAKAHDDEDHITQGKMLGFPDCCVKFFDRVWKDGYFDPVWQIALDDEKKSPPGKLPGESIRTLDAHPFSNPLLRYVGVRVGFHVPCSFHCQKSIAVAQQRLSLCLKSERKDLIPLLTSLLSMPVEWNVYRGIAVVKTPVFYLRTNSIPTKEHYTVRLQGTFKPREAARGVCFPFQENPDDSRK